MSLFLDMVGGKFLQAFLFALCIGIIYVCIRFVMVKKGKSSWGKIGREILKFLMVCYFAGIIALVWVPDWFWSILYGRYDPGVGLGGIRGSFNFVPSIYRYLRGELTGGSWIRTMILGNILMFVPLGIMLPLLLKKNRIYDTMKISLMIVLVVEIVQPFVGRSFDVDDIIYNALGVLVGFVLYKIVNCIFPGLRRYCC